MFLVIWGYLDLQELRGVTCVVSAATLAVSRPHTTLHCTHIGSRPHHGHTHRRPVLGSSSVGDQPFVNLTMT